MNKKEKILFNKFKNTINKYLPKWKLEKWQIGLYYVDYKKAFKIEGVKDFIAFALYLENCDDISDIQISGGLAHDLNGIHKKLFSPKSTEYNKYLKKHYSMEV